MNLKNFKRWTTTLPLAVLFIIPQTPLPVWAVRQPMNMIDVGLPADLFPIDNVIDNAVKPDGKADANTNAGNANNNGNKNTIVIPLRPNVTGTPAPQQPTIIAAPNQTSTIKPTMAPAMVATQYSCPLFDNRPNSELIQAIDSLNKQVVSNPGCKDDASAKEMGSSADQLKKSVEAIQQITKLSDPSKVNLGDIETSVTGAIQATQNIGNILNNSSFLKSECGRQTMSSGQALLSLNNIINGVAPYALMAVSLNAALAPALPFVIGGIAVTSGIAVASKMYKDNTLDMSKPEFRKAILQNTCQYIKVAKKVRFMELAQSGQIDQISMQLQNTIDTYKGRFSHPSAELTPLLLRRDASDKQLAGVQAQLQADQTALVDAQIQLDQNADDLMVCTYVNEMVKRGRDGKSFPSSIVNNFENIGTLVNAPTIQIASTRNAHNISMSRISSLAAKTNDDAAIHTCALTGKAWVNSLRQAIDRSSFWVEYQRRTVDTVLSQSPQFRDWKIQYNQVKIEQVTVNRVEKALEALASDDSLIDRSELSQRMATLKAGLFGTRSIFSKFRSSPVLAWLNHTKSMFDQEGGKFLVAYKKLQEGDLTFSSTGKHAQRNLFLNTMASNSETGFNGIEEREEIIKNMQGAKVLKNFTLQNLPLGSERNKMACQQLESAWLSWSAALDHLGASQLFCNMIDSTLDMDIDGAITKHCRGDIDLNGKENKPSMINAAKAKLVQLGYQAAAGIISAKLKELSCPMPAISEMAK